MTNLRHVLNGKSKYYKIPYKRCTKEDFISSGITVPIGAFLCPNITKEYKDLFTIMNDYSNTDLRKSFSIDVFTCKEKPYMNNKCRSKPDIDHLLKNLHFTMYNLQEN